MYFINMIKEKYPNEKVLMFVDMDGVITDYNFNKPLDFKNKRPIKNNIETFKTISKIPNIILYILSICHNDYQIAEKNNWLNENAPFFKKKNRIIISKESHPNTSSSILKYQTLKEIYEQNKDKIIIHIDDDNEILKYLQKELPNIDLYQDSSIQN